MRRRPILAGATAVLAATFGLPGASGAAASDRPVPVRVFLTTVDRAQLLQENASLQFQPGSSTDPTIVVDPDTSYQRMDGFGASLTDSSAAVLYRLAPGARDAAMRQLFDPRTGIGVGFLRQPVGSSDFTAAAEHYTYDDVPAGQTDYALRHFSVAHDQARVLPLLRQAKRLNPQLTVMATPWSPPAWMKTSGSLVGGRLVDDPKIYDAYARYLLKFVQAYAAAGVPVDYLSLQNEPQNRAPSGYPGTDLPVRQEEQVILRLGPLLARYSPGTRILAYDHNWQTHPNDVATTPPGEDPQTDYPYEILAGPAARWVAGTAYHCYYGDPSAQTALHDAYPDKGIWFTECSGSHGPTDPPAKFFRDTLVWHARTLTIGTTRNWAKSVVNWNLALDGTNGPHLGGCDTCTGLVTVNADGTVTTDAEYYTIGHLSKFVRPGAVRIASTSFGTVGWNGQITDVAFRNPDGSTALVVHNENDDPRSFAVSVNGQMFAYTLPGGALATFTWPRDPRGEHLRAVDLAGATATADPAGETPSAAVDGDASTRWSSGAGQAPGQFLQVDLGGVRAFRRVAIDSGGNLGDYARGWQLSVGDDGTAWRAVASGAGVGQLTTVDLPPTRARYLKIESTATAGNWWSIADVRLYR
ncbi:discoidin domain-containing protein [Hamadaea tsunoensis]|uniref:discoidin domain-containing protein n=1 Tax=Hamadaea tsunoensis TaxID=53368 RepID=UPI000410D03D|nr:discoidin domain-containing protein [Hamadaea tsunoensis]